MNCLLKALAMSLGFDECVVLECYDGVVVLLWWSFVG